MFVENLMFALVFLACSVLCIVVLSRLSRMRALLGDLQSKVDYLLRRDVDLQQVAGAPVQSGSYSVAQYGLRPQTTGGSQQAPMPVIPEPAAVRQSPAPAPAPAAAAAAGYAPGFSPAASAAPASAPMPAPAQVFSPVPTARAQQRSVETTFGRNIIGIVAAVLVFLGLVFLALLVLPYLTDAIKVAVMFAIGLALTASGLALTLSRRNNFTLALLGCGAGALFIAILTTHLYFGMLPAWAAYLALLVWLAVCFMLTRLAHSTAISIIAHAGLALSVLAGYGTGLDVAGLVQLTAYQAVATVLLAAGNALCSQKTRLLGDISGLALCVLVSLALWMLASGRSANAGNQLAELNWLLPLALGVQLAGASALSAMLYRTGLHRANYPEATEYSLGLALANLLLWTAALLLAVPGLDRVLKDARLAAQDVVLTEAWILTAVLAAAGTAVLVCVRRHSLGTAVQRAALVVLSLAAGLALGASGLAYFMHSWNASQFAATPAPEAAMQPLQLLHLPGYLLLFAALVSAYRLTKDNFCRWLAGACLAAEWAAMCLYGFDALAQAFGRGAPGVAACLAYLLLLLAALAAFYYLGEKNARRPSLQPARIAGILAAQLAFGPILLAAHSQYGTQRDFLTLLVLGSLVTLAVALLARFDRGANYPAWRIIRSRRYSLADSDQPENSSETAVGASQATAQTGGALTPDATAFSTFLRIDALGVCLLAIWACLTPGHSAPADAVPVMDVLRGACTLGALSLAIYFICERARATKAFDLLFALAASGLVLALLADHTRLFDEPYVLSLAVMLLALVSVTAGFAARIPTLRIYGLCLSMACIVKLLVADLGFLNSMMRVVAFIGAGLICFGISALYNFAVRRLASEQQR